MICPEKHLKGGQESYTAQPADVTGLVLGKYGRNVPVESKK